MAGGTRNTHPHAFATYNDVQLLAAQIRLCESSSGQLQS